MINSNGESGSLKCSLGSTFKEYKEDKSQTTTTQELPSECRSEMELVRDLSRYLEAGTVQAVPPEMLLQTPTTAMMRGSAKEQRSIPGKLHQFS